MLSRRNFYAKKQLSSKVLPIGARGPVIVPHRVHMDCVVENDGLIVTDVSSGVPHRVVLT